MVVDKAKQQVICTNFSNGKRHEFRLFGDAVAVEVKGTELVTEKHLKGLSQLAEETTPKHQIVVSMDPVERKIGSVSVLPVALFLERLWGGVF